ncbi:LOW QUALITY PROTEIN: hypothetical protein HID58_060447 [Brassica napus]|uniref:Uncharacterized protein n=1 Tax=Brassica napus TaxID=3708 RepID=A0ABQ7ZVR2_BRANA|nr:LOW QUALITY PROTEIN: hypothetical protein HID58_060447 [Brassica napus]
MGYASTRKIKILSPEVLQENTGRSSCSGELQISMWELEETVTKAYKVILMSSTSTVVNDDTSVPPPPPLSYDEISNDKLPIIANGCFLADKVRLPNFPPKLGAIDLHTKTFHTQDWSLTGLIKAFPNLFIAFLLLNMYPQSQEAKSESYKHRPSETKHNNKAQKRSQNKRSKTGNESHTVLSNEGIIQGTKLNEPYASTRKLKILSPEVLQENTGRSSWSGELPISMWELEETVTKAYKVILMSLTSTVVNDDTSVPPPPPFI